LPLLSILLALVSLASPRVPGESESDTVADASWSSVLGYAHEHGLQFGQDIVFTYGPLGFLATPFSAQGSIGLRLISDTLLSLAVGTGLALLALRLGRFWRLFFLATAIFLLGNIFPRTDLLIELGVISWGLLSVVEADRTQRLAVSVFVGVAVFAALVKFTLLILAVLSVGAVGLDFLFRRKWRWVVWLGVGFVASFVLGWVVLGQNALHLADFVRKALIISQGYNQAMAYEGSQELRWRGTFVVLTTTAALLVRIIWFTPNDLRSILWRRATLTVWLLGALLLVWKHGFVRTDLYHAGFFFGLAPLLALGVEALPTRNTGARFWGRVTASLGWFVCLVTVQSIVLPGNIVSSLLQPCLSLRDNALKVVAPSTFHREMNEALAVQRNRGQLPGLKTMVSQSGIDMFGFEQSEVLFNDLNYVPRPVFQSYAAYNAPLMQFNEAFYLSPRAPDYVLFRLMSMDRKFPPLEDARTFRHLLINFEPAGNNGSFLLLKSKSASAPQLKLLTEGTIHPRQKLPLDVYGEADLWIEFGLQPTLQGKMQAFIYQPPKVRLAIWYGTADLPKIRRFRAPAPMLASGFLISPLLINNDDVIHLYEGAGYTRPLACTIELNSGTEQFWKQTIPFRILQIENQLGRCGPEALSKTKARGFESTGSHQEDGEKKP
jgi:hypothetical protein